MGNKARTVNEAEKIFKKYKNNCNAIVTNKWDGKFGDKHILGGYECGDNDYWTDKCVPSYCDIEYAFNHKLKKSLKRKNYIKLIIIIILLILIFVINIYLLIELNNKINEDTEEELPLIFSFDNF